MKTAPADVKYPLSPTKGLGDVYHRTPVVIPPGYEYVDFRPPRTGDVYLDNYTQRVSVSTVGFSESKPRVIVRKALAPLQYVVEFPLSPQTKYVPSFKDGAEFGGSLTDQQVNIIRRVEPLTMEKLRVAVFAVWPDMSTGPYVRECVELLEKLGIEVESAEV